MVQTELHRHLDVSLRLSTVLELAQDRGLVPQSTSLESFRHELWLKKPLKNLSTVIDHFDLFRKIQDRPDVLERVGYEVVEDCYYEGTRLLELRFSPDFICGLNQMSWQEALESLQRGLARAQAKYPAIRAGLICIATREFGPESVGKTIEFFMRNRSSLIGLDLAGYEEGYPPHTFQDLFAEPKRQGVPITIHAGEACGPENIWEAIDCLGAKRIGHGIACVKDPKLMDRLARDRICLEMCPTSNWITQVVPSLDAHPLPQVLRRGIPVSINTDDPGVFGAFLPDEIEICRKNMGMTQSEVDDCMRHAEASSFLRFSS